MKIGQVSKKYGVSIDSLNYYARFGLLVPPKNGGQRNFDSKTIQDLELLIELKDLKFTLNEIYQIITLRRISNLADKKDIQELIVHYQNKRDECVEESQNFLKSAQKLDAKISELNYTMLSATSQIGAPIRMLDLLCCPDCGGNMDISDSRMNLRYIFSGKLVCKCGYHAEVSNGIVITPNKNMDIHDTPDVDRDMYKHLPLHLITLFQNAYNWMIGQLSEIQTENKVVMETYVNAWFFLHNHLEYLHPAGRYIIVDKYPETLAAYKQIIEGQSIGLDILYIADSSTKLPVKKHCVDVNIDFFAINEHNFYHRSFLLDKLCPYFSPDALMLGTYFYFKNGIQSMKNLLEEYPACAEYNFNKQYFIQAMKNGAYEIIQKQEIGSTTDCGKNIGFSFHQFGEHMHLMSYLAKLGAP